MISSCPHSSTSTTGEFHPTCSPEHVSTHSCGNAYYSPYHTSSSCPPRLGISRELHIWEPLPPAQDPYSSKPKDLPNQSITGKSLSRHNVRYLAGPITLCVGHLHKENIQLLVLENATPTSGTLLPRRRATQLPPHRPWDCAIYLLPGESVPKGKIFSLSLPEQKAMEEYIEEALQ